MNREIIGIKKLKKFCFIALYKLSSKLVAIKKVKGGPKTIQQKNEIIRSAKTIINSLLILERFLN